MTSFFNPVSVGNSGPIGDLFDGRGRKHSESKKENFLLKVLLQDKVFPSKGG